MKKNIWKIVFAASLVLIVVASINIFILARQYQAGINTYQNLEKYVEVIEVPEIPEVQDAQPAEEDTESEEVVSTGPKIPIRLNLDYDSLTAINDEFVCWLYYAPLDINYPVVRGTDNDYYLHYTFENERVPAGAIFMEFLNKPDMTNYNTIIYGHNMRNGTMFGSLDDLLRDNSIISQNPYFYIFTKEKSYMYEIFSVYITDASSDTYNLIRTEEEQAEHIEYIKSVSTYYAGREVYPSDKITTLSTCYGVQGDNRTVVQGVLVAEEDR